MVKAYPSEPALEARLCALDELIAQRAADDREKNLRRLYLFSDRLDYTDNAATWRRFPELVAPFSDPYPADPAFAAVFTEVHGLQSAFENAEALLAESRTRDCLKICNGVLERRPGNLLFRRLEEKAKGREWVSLLAESAAQRARAFEAHAQYVEALEEWESLRGIDPHYPGLDSEILNCAALRERSGNACPAERQLFEEVPAEEIPLVAETREEWTEIEPPAFAHRNRPNLSPLGIRISMTEEAWNHFKTGLAATAALLLVVLVLASHARP
jgi:hypothetical protein